MKKYFEIEKVFFIDRFLNIFINIKCYKINFFIHMNKNLCD
jgi:hypothetical protein